MLRSLLMMMPLRRLPVTVVLSILAVHVIALDVIVWCAMRDGHFGKYVTATGAAIMAFGATAAMCRRTWGVGVMLACAVSYAAAGALGMGPSFFFLVAAIGASPFLFTVKYMARFDVGATLLFTAIAAALGVTATLAWHELAPTILPMVESPAATMMSLPTCH